MYNSDILTHLISKYGIDDVIYPSTVSRQRQAAPSRT